MKLRVLPKIIIDPPGPKSQSLAKQLRQVESPNITYLSSAFPIFWREGKGCLVKDADRNWYLDMSASFGVLTLGHSHPQIARTIARQSRQLIHGMGDIHPSLVKVHCAREIAKRVPLTNGKVIFGLSGSDAVEAALKTALKVTGKPKIIAFEGAYHGLSYGALNATWRQDFKEPFQEQLPSITTHIPFPNTIIKEKSSLEQIEKALKSEPIGAVIFEPIQGRGGINIAPQAWMLSVKNLCKQYGALLISDEIFCGWGRTGNWTVCQCADIYCLGKSLAGGLPLSACVAESDIMSSWGESTGEAIHTSTFLGHPLACTLALTTINELERLRLLDKSKEKGESLMTLLKQEVPDIVEIRGQGLMIGIQLKTASAQQAAEQALKKGLIVLPAGNGDVIELTPPLIINQQQIDYSAQTLASILKKQDDF